MDYLLTATTRMCLDICMSNTATTNTTSHARVAYRASGELRRDWFRIMRHMKDPAEVAAHLYSPQYWWAADPATMPLTEEQWRQVGLASGQCF